MPPETCTSLSNPEQDRVVFCINELTRSFVKGTLKILMKMLEVDCGALFLFDPARETLVLDSVQGSALSDRMLQRWPAAKSSLSIPLSVKGQLFGRLEVGARADGRNFSQTELRFADALCNHTCRIVEDQAGFIFMRKALEGVVREKSVLEKYCTVGNLAVGIVGEINSPLDGALRYAGLMSPHMDGSPPRQQEYLSEIKKGLERISDITADLSLMGNPLHMPSVGQPAIDIHKILNESIDIFGAAFKNSIKISVNYKGPLRVRMDTDIRHVFINVIKNAIDAMPSGGELEISSEIKQAGLQMYFRDTGIGISPDDQESIFEPFFTTKPKGSGTGIGLALCRDIAAKYGGRIGVKSAPGKGSTFTILFPREILA